MKKAFFKALFFVFYFFLFYFLQNIITFYNTKKKKGCVFLYLEV